MKISRYASATAFRRALEDRLQQWSVSENLDITQFNNNHYAVVDPAIATQGRLVLFLPGTGATPALHRDFPQNAASLGFHALGLM